MASNFPALAPEAVARDRNVPMALELSLPDLSLPKPAPPDASAEAPSFDRAAVAILGTMVTLIVVLTALLVTVSAPDGSDPAPTAQGAQSPHHA